MKFADQVNAWEQNKRVPYYLKKELKQKSKDEAWLEDAFGTNLEFGTAGMRGLMEPGLNRMNLFTVGKITEGLALLIDKLGQEVKQKGVVICYDPRYHSAEFATHAAQILGYHGIKVYLFDSLRPTPELSFTIRYLKTYAGIMITASHNPKDYNGYKIYGPDGGQMPPKEVAAVVEYANSVQDIFEIHTKEFSKLREEDIVELIGEDIDQAYLNALQSVNLDRQLIDKVSNELKIVYSPLHGTGKVLYQRVFSQNGFKNVEVVTKQAILDPEFTSVPSPNPESPRAFDEGLKIAKQNQADLIIATDPDADRMGCMVLNQTGKYLLLTGNQIAALMTNYLVSSLLNSDLLDEKMEIVKSIVSSELPFVIAKHFGIKTKNVLTGFKFIGEEIERLETTKSGKFIFGFEESYGFLFKDFVRDKDSMQAALIMSEVAAYYKNRDMTVVDGLQEIYAHYGFFLEETHSIEITGLDGVSQMQALMKKIRADNLQKLANQKVSRIEDYLLQTVSSNEKVTKFTDFPVSDVLKYYLEDGSWIALRPSGTEPKIKVYYGVKEINEATAKEKILLYRQAFEAILQD